MLRSGIVSAGGIVDDSMHLLHFGSSGQHCRCLDWHLGHSGSEVVSFFDFFDIFEAFSLFPAKIQTADRTNIAREMAAINLD